MIKTPLDIDYTRDELISAIASEYDYLCHDDFTPGVDMTQSEYVAHLNTLTDDELVDEADCHSLDEYMCTWG